ncbi:DUF2487 family protein [Cohnella thermotolerans]|uniref:DUF2487 family protein n=1 Tax=Cohnella thermotolerans TaxID=329858 RepID=UPI00040C1125|nr:DUF2487 family protein [Cohnella thermotolerans]
MKFSELDTDRWADLQPYLDTCLLPVSGLNGRETPAEATDKIAAAGDWLAPIETAFRGRTVTLPAYHYYDPEDEAETRRLERYCAKVKSVGFRYLVIVSGERLLTAESLPFADLIVGPGSAEALPDTEAIRQAVTSMWKNNGA